MVKTDYGDTWNFENWRPIIQIPHSVNLKSWKKVYRM